MCIKNIYYLILAVIFEDAYKDEIISRNPTRLATTLPKSQLGKTEAFSMEEIDKKRAGFLEKSFGHNGKSCLKKCLK